MLCSGLVLAFFAFREPAYGGKSLTQWVEAYVSTEGLDSPSTKPDPADAIRQIGPEALPYLVKWIGDEPPPWKTKLDAAVNFVRDLVKPSLGSTDERDLRAEGAKEAFYVIGAQAQPAIRDLARLANNPKASLACAERAVVALGYIGKDALPALLAVLQSTQRGSVRASAARRIENMGVNALLAVPFLLHCVRDEEDSVAVSASDILSTLRLDPALIVPVWMECLQDSRFNVRRRAMLYLEDVGIKAGAAVPALVGLLNDADRDIRAAAIKALQRIEPEVLEKVGGQ